MFTQVQVQKTLGFAQFGDSGRFMIEVIQDRFGMISFFVRDAYVIDEITGVSAVVRQNDNINEIFNDLDDNQTEPFKNKIPQKGDLVINLKNTVGKFKDIKGSDWVLQCPITKEKWIANPDKCLVIKDDCYQDWD